MKNYLTDFAVAASAFLIVVVATAALADRPSVGMSPHKSLVTEISAQTTASSRDTTCMSVDGESYLMLDITADRDGTPVLTGVTTTCYGYRENACADTIPKQLPLCVDNVCAAYSPAWTVDADEGWSYRFDVAGFWLVKCTLSFTNGDAGDTVTVKRLSTRE